ncbi:HP0495 family protein [Seleniivibrio woodruffii]|uniref:Uncharacterized protein n=1 Tax=Seleniivibrio woodruffii TaxID=1078050 RepID=A0A4R1KE68_9BACT|nr:DUF493 domain-containing protein [Seleniivibrio woodruffii]TCK62293.1 hypothetical protein C8D98_0815 [Seleniivibrio woodruffii]TVZ34589.1 hypothetical protein OF66_0178 [Seleniivibrio woodruffii]
MTNSMKELIEFPTIFTFKAMGDNTDDFRNNIKEVFSVHSVEAITENVSTKGTYTAISVTVSVNDFDEMQHIYTKIKQTKGLKYHL